MTPGNPGELGQNGQSQFGEDPLGNRSGLPLKSPTNPLPSNMPAMAQLNHDISKTAFFEKEMLLKQNSEIQIGSDRMKKLGAQVSNFEVDAIVAGLEGREIPEDQVPDDEGLDD